MDSKLDDIARPMISPRKRKLLAGLVSLAVLTAAYAGYWFYLAGQMRSHVEKQTASLIAQGFDAGYERLAITGFPSDVTVTLDKIGITTPDGTHFRAERMVGALSPFSPARLTVSLKGNLQTRFVLQDRLRTFTGVADRFDADVNANGKTTRWQADLRVENLEMVETASGDVMGVSYLKAQAQANTAPDPSAQQSAYDLLVRATDARLPKRLSSPWGNTVKEATIEASLMGRIPKAHTLQNALATWRDIGGTLQILRLSLDQGPVHLATEGTLALDGALQPVGRAIARVSGYIEIIDALVDRQVMRPRDAPLAKMVLGALAKRPETGGRSILNVPLTLKNRTLYAGPVALTRFDRIDWDFLKNLM